MKVHVLGTGLIGTSVGLALAGSDVVLSDPSEDNLSRAVSRGAGRRWDGAERADLALVCAPPDAVSPVIAAALAQNLASTISHVASHQSAVQAEVETRASVASLDAFCGGHPMAGRERAGPDAATGRLFVDRPWVVCPASRTGPSAVRAVESLARACGAVPVQASAEDHDAAVALVSHLPQLASSAVAARLVDGVQDGSAFDPLRLAGPGVQDVTRIAGSDPDLWVQVLVRNARQVAPLARALAEELQGVAEVLTRLGEGRDEPQPDVQTLRAFLQRGREGRRRLPVKQGRVTAAAAVVVAVSDQPGQLARVLGTAAQAGVNVEDVRVEHLAGRPRGLVELLVPSALEQQARSALSAAGWEVLDAG